MTESGHRTARILRASARDYCEHVPFSSSIQLYATMFDAMHVGGGVQCRDGADEDRGWTLFADVRI